MSTIAIDQKIVVITGCSSGIGLNLALSLSKSPKYKVIATLRTPSAAPESLKTSKCEVLPLDVTSDTSVQSLTEILHENHGSRCDVLINNAGFGISGSMEDVRIEDAKRVFDVNVFGAMRTCKAMTPLMKNKQNGMIITISSLSGIIAQPFSDIYTSSKMAVEGMMEAYRYAVEQYNIKVLMINPGATDTDFAKRFKKESSSGGSAGVWAREIENRNLDGQDVGECVEEIERVMEREIGKNIADGTDYVKFWNGTSEFGKRVIEQVKGFPDGVSGIYEARFETGRQVVKQAALEKNNMQNQ